MQRTFLEALRSAGRFRPGARVVPWLLGNLAHEAARLRRERRGSPDHVATRPAPAVQGPPERAPANGSRGNGAAAAATPPPALPVPKAVRDGEPERPLRYEVVDALSAASKRIPGLNGALRRMLRAVGRVRRSKQF